jgi:hypothetical protein
VLAYVLFGGGKKFGKLGLVHPYHAIFGLQRHTRLPIFGVVYDYFHWLIFF